MRMKRRETQRQGSIGVRELGHARARPDCFNSSPSGCVPTPPGKTLLPGFLSHEVTASHLVIFRQDTPDHASGQGTNGGPTRGADQPDNHGIAYRQ